MDYKEHYSEALAYLRDYCLRHGRPMHFSSNINKKIITIIIILALAVMTAGAQETSN